MASQMNPRGLKNLSRPSTTSTENDKLQPDLSLLEVTRKLFRILGSDFSYLNSIKRFCLDKLDPKDEAAALEEIDICLKNLNITRNALNEKDEDYKSIMLRLQIAFKIAKENEHLLTEAQRQLVDVRIQEENQTTTSIDDWLPIQVPDTSVMPTKDEIALSFYEKLSEENKVKFDKLHRFLFYCSFAHHIEVFQKEIHHPDNTFDHPFPRNPECIIFSEKGKFDSLLTSRMAILALKAKRFVIDKDTFIPIRSTAIQQLEEEQMKALGNENVQQFIEGEVELRNSVDEWITQQIDEESFQG